MSEKIPALRISNLRKSYGDLEVLKGIDFQINDGDFFGLLGHNGAGKTTMIGIITDLVNKNSGDVKIFGTSIDADFPKAKGYVGVVPQEFNFDIFSKVIDILITQAGFYGIPKNVATQRAEELLKKLDLYDKKDAKAMMLSGGMKRRLMIARALVHEPKLLILDEPTAGVDVELRKTMWDFLVDLNKSGTTILLTTHYLEEAESLCNNIAIISKGKIIENTDKRSLLKKLDSQEIVIELKDNVSQKQFSEIESKLKQFKPQLENDCFVTLEFSSKKSTLNEIVKAFDELKLEIINISNKTNRLEKLFIDLTK